MIFAAEVCADHRFVLRPAVATPRRPTVVSARARRPEVVWLAGCAKGGRRTGSRIAPDVRGAGVVVSPSMRGIAGSG